MDYDINYLCEIFKIHSEQCEDKFELERKEYFNKNNVNECEIPELLLKPFNLSEALRVICEEIKALKEK